MPAHAPISRPRALFLGIALWLALAPTSAFLLLYHTHQRLLEQSLLTRTAHLAALPLSQETLDQTIRLDPTLAYAMVWSDDGRVLLHTHHPLIATYLDEKQWPALDPQQPSRLNTLTPPPAWSPAPVLEATVRLPAAAPRTFLTLALKTDAANAQFWSATRPLQLLIATLTLTGACVIAAAIVLALRRLEKSQREIEQNARARTSLLTERGMLASVLAHEVRSPLTALRFNLHTLRSLISAPTPTARQLELADRSEREILRLDQMLSDFLLRTQIISTPEPASINTVIKEALDFLAPALEQRHIKVSLHLDPADPHALVHPDELRQVILNLAANAQDAMPPKPSGEGGTLAISTLAPTTPPPFPQDTSPPPLSPQSSALSTPSVTILVRDSGTGIPADLHERIFEPFFSTKPNGSGLGLALVRRVISGAGGTVFCESTPTAMPGGGGTTFRILLPASPQVPPV